MISRMSLSSISFGLAVVVLDGLKAGLFGSGDVEPLEFDLLVLFSRSYLGIDGLLIKSASRLFSVIVSLTVG